MKKSVSVLLSMLMIISVCSAAGAGVRDIFVPKALAAGLTVDFSFAAPTAFDENNDPGYYYVRTVNGQIVPYIAIGTQAVAAQVMGYATVEELHADADIFVCINNLYVKAADAPADKLTADTVYYLFNFVHIGDYNDCVDAGYSHDEIINDIYCYLEPTNDVPGYYHAGIIIGGTIPEDTQFFVPKKLTGTVRVPTGTYFSFIVITEPMYNIATVDLKYTKGDFSGDLELNINKEYVVYADDNVTIDLAECDELGNEVLLRNHFTVLMEGKEGYKIDTLEGTNRKVVYYGDGFDFRVKILNGYTAAGMSVYVARGENDLSNLIGEDLTFVMGMLGSENVQQLTSYGIDADGNKLYHVDNITTNINISVNGVNTDKFAEVLNMLKRILKLILDALGIDTSRLGLLNTYNVTINCDNSVTSCIVSQGYDDAGARNFQVMSGTNVAIIITKPVNDTVTVTWTPGNETGTAFTPLWLENGNGTSQAVFYVDNVVSDLTINVVKVD